LQDLRNYQITKSEARDILYSLSLSHYVKSLGFKTYEWQERVLKSEHKRKAINGARQSGKSTIITTKPSHKAKYKPESLSIIMAPTERQAYLNMQKIKTFIKLDRTFPKIDRYSDQLIELNNGSRIVVVPATETSARGDSKPDIIILDEASRIDEAVYKSGVVPMLTENPDCELIDISTPNGKFGFHFNAMNNPKWERYEIRAPWEVDEINFTLYEAEPEETYQRKCAEKGIIGYYSPRHRNKEEQLFNLGEMGVQMYKQEYGVQFVEPSDQVFSYDEIEKIMNNNVEALDFEEIGVAQSFDV